ncbi:MAG: hypothetical protein WA160_13970 [Pseudobdellovibrio sp.]
MTYNNRFFILIIFALSLCSQSCGPVENSASLDRTLYGSTLDVSGSTALFASVRTSLSKCQACHGSWLSLKEADFITLGLVVAKSPDTSKIYYRNQTATSGPGPKNMPSGGNPALSAAEIQNMINWINGL